MMSGHGVHGRRISSLSVTYQEEYRNHKPAEANLSVANATSICASQSQDPAVPGEQSLEDICDDFQGLSGVQTLSNPPSFYPTPSRQTTPQPLCNDAPNGGQLPLPATLPVAPCVPWPVGNPLYGLEDSLRHKINIQVEEFRAAVQQILGEHFNLYRFPVHNSIFSYQPPESSYCRFHDSHVVPAGDPPQGRTDEGAYSEDSEGYDAVVQSNQLEMEDTCLDSCPGSYQNFSPQDSVYSCDASTGTTDSGIMSEPSVDQQIDHCLIQIQTYASVITHTLRRTEYSTS